MESGHGGIIMAFLAILVVLFFGDSMCVMLSKYQAKVCPNDEIHWSCAFHEEYTCWKTSKRLERVRMPPKRLVHCRSGCYCKKGLVREFPGGRCVQGINCYNIKLRQTLKNIPTEIPR